MIVQLKRFVKKYRRWVICALVIVIFAIVGCWTYALISTASSIYGTRSLHTIPKERVAIVFGARVNDTTPTPYLQFRIQAAVDLYKAGRVQKLLMTGDNSTDHYNEPTVMRNVAVSLGVKSSDITIDYAGFSTYDSCYRAKNIFGVTDAVLVSQAYHLPRAVMTCQALGIKAIGYRANVTDPALEAEYVVREWFSTDKAVLQIATHAKPVFLGPHVPIR